MFQTKVVEKIKTHFMFDNPYSENLTIYNIMLKNIVVILISFPLQWWLMQTHFSVTLYICCLLFISF